MTEKSNDTLTDQRLPESEQGFPGKGFHNSDEKYRILFEKSKDAFLVIENEKFIDCNQAALDMLGFSSKTDLLHTHPSDLSPDRQPDGRDSSTKAKEMMDIAIKKGSYRFEWNHVRSNGEIFPVEVLLTTISSKKDNCVIHTIWRDISHRKQVERIRQKERETLSTILESTPHGIALIDNQGKYLYVNPYFTKITGYTLKDIPTKDAWFKKAYPDKRYRETVSGAWNRDGDHSGIGKVREFQINCKDGRPKQIEFRTAFLKDQKISVLTDVTARKQTEEMLREKDRLQGILELSGAVCHEMNQPLMSIQGYFDLIQMDIAKDSPLYSKFAKIQVQIDRLSNITKKLMEISRYETKDYLKEKIVDLAKASPEKN